MKACTLIGMLLLLPLAPARSGEQHLRGQWSPLVWIPYSGVYPQRGYPLAVDDLGIRHVVYTGGGLPCYDTVCGVYYQSSQDGMQWSPPVLVPGSEDVGWLCAPEVLTSGTRVYVAWFGSLGFEITWTDDQGAHFAPTLTPAPATPGGLQMGSACDVTGALHFVWAGGANNLYYLRSWSAGNAFVPGLSTPDPVFLPAQRLSAEDGMVAQNTSVGVDQKGFVSIVYDQESTPGHVRFTRAYQGVGFPPSIALDDKTYCAQLSVSPEGPITVAYARFNPNRSQVFTRVSMDGTSWEGPFQQTFQYLAGFDRMPGTRPGKNGRVYAAWAEAITVYSWETTCAVA
ncbi:MAG: hypothetical protein U1E76_26170 [Planctomycetota bacterium]